MLHQCTARLPLQAAGALTCCRTREPAAPLPPCRRLSTRPPRCIVLPAAKARQPLLLRQAAAHSGCRAPLASSALPSVRSVAMPIGAMLAAPIDRHPLQKPRWRSLAAHACRSVCFSSLGKDPTLPRHPRRKPRRSTQRSRAMKFAQLVVGPAGSGKVGTKEHEDCRGAAPSDLRALLPAAAAACRRRRCLPTLPQALPAVHARSPPTARPSRTTAMPSTDQCTWST